MLNDVFHAGTACKNASICQSRPHSVSATSKPASLFALAIALIVASNCGANDWPQFLGPNRNGTYDGSDIAEVWPATSPRIAWRKDIGHGFSGPVVANRRLILFHRVDDQERVLCLDSRTGDQIWVFSYPTTYQDDFG